MGAGQFLIGEIITNRCRFIINWDSSCYYKSGQRLLQIGAARFITNRGRVVTSQDNYCESGHIYYKSGQLL